MLRIAMYLNYFILLLISIILLIIIFPKKSDLKRLRYLIITYLIFSILDVFLFYLDIVNYDIFFVLLFPFLGVPVIINIISLLIVCIKIKKSTNTDYKELSIKKIIILAAIPVIIFLVPYIYELFMLNNCSYILTYEDRSGVMFSETEYIAIVNNKPVTVTLKGSIFSKNGQSTNDIHYTVDYSNNTIKTKDSKNNKTLEENIKQIALDAKTRCSSANVAMVCYLPEGKYAIVNLMEEEDSETNLGTYIYHNNKYIQATSIGNNFQSVTYYK